MLIPGLANYILNEDGVTPIEDEDGGEFEVDEIVTRYNIKYLFDGKAVINQMDIPTELTDPIIITSFIRESLLVYYSTLPVYDQPEQIYSVQYYLTEIAPSLNPDYAQPGWPYRPRT